MDLFVGVLSFYAIVLGIVDNVKGDSCSLATVERISCGAATKCAERQCCFDSEADQCYHNISKTAFTVNATELSVATDTMAYKLINEGKTNTEARTTCEDDGGTLLKLDNLNQLYQIRAAMVLLKAETGSVMSESWIGGFTSGTDTTEPLTDFTDYSLTSGESCLLGSFYDSLPAPNTWNLFRKNCGSSKKPICQYSTVVPITVEDSEDNHAGDLVDGKTETCISTDKDFMATYIFDSNYTVAGLYDVKLKYNTTITDCTVTEHVFGTRDASCLTAATCALISTASDSCTFRCRCYQAGRTCRFLVLLGTNPSQMQQVALCEVHVPTP